MSDSVADSRRPDPKRLGAVVLFGLAVYWLIPRPESVEPEGWRLFAVFSCAIAGLVIRPLAGGAVILICLVAAVLTGALGVDAALSGYGSKGVWLVVGALLVAKALIKTGLAKRIALWFVRHFGSKSSGIAYALIFSDVTLAMMIPSNTSRSGGVILPIARSLAELYGSHPGKTAGLLGTFLMAVIYQGEAVASAMFLTGQAGNFIAADIAMSVANYELSWGRWALAGIVPGLVSIIGLVWIVSRLLPPEIQNTPRATEFAEEELLKLGGMGRDQWITVGVFITVCGLWMTSTIHSVPVAIAALLGASILILTGVLTWDEVIREHSTWDIFVWYGGVISLGNSLTDAGVPAAFAQAVSGTLGEMHWLPLMGATLLVYFYAHYGLASITMHMLTMLPPFLLLLLTRDAPLGLTVFLFVCLANLSAGLTHYGTVPGPIFFSQGYVSFADWWRVGFLISLWNILVWCTVGAAWWKLIGIW
jgi:DASS family divalent anion:Na+ symporter